MTNSLYISEGYKLDYQIIFNYCQRNKYLRRKLTKPNL